MLKKLPYFLLSAVWLSTGLSAADEPKKDTKPAADEKAEKGEKEGKGKEDEPKESKKVTHGTVKLAHGPTVAYTATAGTMSLLKPEGEARASVFYISYTLDEAKDTPSAAKRPVVFCFNGGPGSSSVWLHLGAFGPRRVALPPGGVQSPKPPYELIPNEFSILDVADLVFIDPVSTGYSRAQKGEDPKQFHGYTNDLDSVGDFIRRWTTTNQRWASPKFIGGESYGGLRAAGLAGHLQQRYGMFLNGLIIVSGVVDFATLAAAGSNDLPYLAFLPSFTATAHYHKKLSPARQAQFADTMAAVTTFAQGPYATALLRGNALPVEEKKAIAEQLADLTGLGADVWLRNRLRLESGKFQGLLLEKEELEVGRFDSRATAPAGTGADDPSYSNVYGAFSTCLNAYVRGTLEFENDQPYEILTSAVRPWSYEPFTNRFVSSADPLAEAMANNPHLRLYVACGWYDMATPAAGIRHTLDHLPLGPGREKDITVGYFEGGHMMYSNLDALKDLNAQIRAFITKP
jgi:carboxypeptidase C (cathepsin A)